MRTGSARQVTGKEARHGKSHATIPPFLSTFFLCRCGYISSILTQRSPKDSRSHSHSHSCHSVTTGHSHRFVPLAIPVQNHWKRVGDMPRLITSEGQQVERGSAAPSPRHAQPRQRCFCFSSGCVLLTVGENGQRRLPQKFEMRRCFASLRHSSQLLLPRGPPLRPMSTTPSASPFSNSCSQLDELIKKLESDLGVQEPFDVKKAMSAQGKHASTTAAAAPAAPHKPAPAVTLGAAAAAGAATVSGSASAQDPTAKPKKEKVDKPAAPPKAPPVRTLGP